MTHHIGDLGRTWDEFRTNQSAVGVEEMMQLEIEAEEPRSIDLSLGRNGCEDLCRDGHASQPWGFLQVRLLENQFEQWWPQGTAP